MTIERFRPVDPWHFRYFNNDDATIRAADEIINRPDKHLLTQDDIYHAEGGHFGVGVQVGAIVLGLTTLFLFKPKYALYLKNA